MPSDRQLKRTIAALKTMERKCFGSRQRFAFYDYLDEVLSFYQLLRRKNEAKMSANRIAELFGIRQQKRTHSIRVIIDATSAADEKTKSRWSRALRYAWHERERWKKFRTFLQLNGGPAGCAEKFAALHPRTPDGCVRIGGEDRVPKIPLFVDVELLKPGQLFVKDGKVFTQPDVTETVGTSDLQNGREPEPLKKFIKREGGINECASRFAARLGRSSS